MAGIGGSGFFPGQIEPGGLFSGQPQTAPITSGQVTETAYTPGVTDGGGPPVLANKAVGPTNEFTAVYTVGATVMPANFLRMVRFEISFRESQTLDWSMSIEDEDGSLFPGGSTAGFPLPIAPFDAVLSSCGLGNPPGVPIPQFTISVPDETKLLTVSGTLFNSVTNGVEPWGPWVCVPLAYSYTQTPENPTFTARWTGKGVMVALLNSKHNFTPITANGYNTISSIAVLQDIFNAAKQSASTNVVSWPVARFSRQRETPAAWIKNILDKTQAEWIELNGGSVVSCYQPNFKGSAVRIYNLGSILPFTGSTPADATAYLTSLGGSIIKQIQVDESSVGVVTQLTGQRADDVGAVLGSQQGGPFQQYTVQLSRPTLAGNINVVVRSAANGLIGNFFLCDASGNAIEIQQPIAGSTLPPTDGANPCTQIKFNWAAELGQTTAGAFRVDFRADTGNYSDTVRAACLPVMSGWNTATGAPFTGQTPIPNGLPGYGCVEEELGADPLLSDIATLNNWLAYVFFKRGAQPIRKRIQVPFDPFTERGQCVYVADARTQSFLMYIEGINHVLGLEAAERWTTLDLVIYQQLQPGGIFGGA